MLEWQSFFILKLCKRTSNESYLPFKNLCKCSTNIIFWWIPFDFNLDIKKSHFFNWFWIIWKSIIILPWLFFYCTVAEKRFNEQNRCFFWKQSLIQPKRYLLYENPDLRSNLINIPKIINKAIFVFSKAIFIVLVSLLLQEMINVKVRTDKLFFIVFIRSQRQNRQTSYFLSIKKAENKHGLHYKF
jgi:hypothetical protein